MCRTVATLISHRVSSADGFPFQATGNYYYGIVRKKKPSAVTRYIALGN
ncbi:hypothetical protein OOU_Y34scaffold00666g237 [Pyricularia oryzae Y34]|uniref:Uncharacterized protein n=3 Tax=Pyricularia oryzae TaxID=318829 RepID=Q2KGN2_PYRO7|nr:hypothetical protein MGCH7_ch7g303 [Pyricularia oryzae 70-15]ELQ36376.1 hypothetical protein OOU_Y34scaffold00666g237 [Pyricularia oryzae Y34]